MRRERTIFHVGMTHAPVNICRGGRLCPPETLDNAGRMGIIKMRGRCDKRSTLEVNDFSQNKKPSLGRVAVSAFQLHNSNRDGVPPDMKCKRPKHSLTPLRRGARGAFIQRLSLRQRFAPPPSQMEARGVPRLRARGCGLPRQSADCHASLRTGSQ